MSAEPSAKTPLLDGRVDPNISRVPSHDSDARVSPAAVLMPFSRWTRLPHRSSSDDRVAVQISGLLPPIAPVRVESQTISRPSWRTFGRASLAVLSRPGARYARPKSTL